MNKNESSLITPIILAGGSGTRLWPLSRSQNPKQFLNLYDKYSMLQLTLLRLRDKLFADPIIIAGEDHRFIVAEQAQKIGFKNCKIILEPEGKNTTAAIAIAATYSEYHKLPVNMLILSADHFIDSTKNFISCIKKSLKYSQNKKLVCFGIKPNQASTKFGYINYEEYKPINKHAAKITHFCEKPNLSKAKLLIKKNALWNSGIFCFQYDSIIREIEKFEPNILKLSRKALENSAKDIDFVRLDKDIFKKIKSISIDNSIFENSKNAVVIKTNFTWSDLGTFNALWEIDKKDANNNVIKGDIVFNKLKNSYIYSEKTLVTVSNLENILLIVTKDAILASKLNESDDIKKITQLLTKRIELHESLTTLRPWGYFENINSEKNFKVKKLFIYPGKKLSLQQHKKRAEHWIIISGKAKVTKNNKVFYLTSNQSTFIPKMTKHRLENNTKKPLVIIEVQTGNYFGEDDIKRFKDIYGRI